MGVVPYLMDVDISSDDFTASVFDRSYRSHLFHRFVMKQRKTAVQTVRDRISFKNVYSPLEGVGNRNRINLFERTLLLPLHVFAIDQVKDVQKIIGRRL